MQLNLEKTFITLSSLNYLVVYRLNLSYLAAFGRVYYMFLRYVMSQLCRFQWESVGEFRWRQCSFCWFMPTPLPPLSPPGCFSLNHLFSSALHSLSQNSLNLLLSVSLVWFCYSCRTSGAAETQAEMWMRAVSFSFMLCVYTKWPNSEGSSLLWLYLMKHLLWLLLFKASSLWVCKYWWGSSLSPWIVYLFISLSVCCLSVEFREPRVIELWEAAKRANLSEDELDSLKVALKSLMTVFWTLRLSRICL